MKEQMIVLFCEGRTDELFFKRLLNYFCVQKSAGIKYEVKNVQGVSKCREASRIMEKRFFNNKKLANFSFYVFVAFDTDVTEYSKKPPFNEEVFKELKKSLEKYKKRINGVYPLKVEKCIEDWFLADVENIYKYLAPNYKGQFKVPQGKSGLEKLSKIFKQFNQPYLKGDSCKGLIDLLNIEKIINKNIKELRKLLEVLNIEL